MAQLQTVDLRGHGSVAETVWEDHRTAGRDPLPALSRRDDLVLVQTSPLDFDAFFLAERPRVVALVFALSGDRGHAEDIAQEALLRAYRRWGTVGAYDRPGAWVRRVALNLATSARRRRRSERRAVERVAARPPAAVLDLSTTEFWAMVRTLPRQQAVAVALHYLEDERVADIALVLGCAEGTAKAHLYQARAALAERFADTEECP